LLLPVVEVCWLNIPAWRPIETTTCYLELRSWCQPRCRPPPRRGLLEV